MFQLKLIEKIEMKGTPSRLKWVVLSWLRYRICSVSPTPILQSLITIFSGRKIQPGIHIQGRLISSSSLCQMMQPVFGCGTTLRFFPAAAPPHQFGSVKERNCFCWWKRDLNAVWVRCSVFNRHGVPLEEGESLQRQKASKQCVFIDLMDSNRPPQKTCAHCC